MNNTRTGRVQRLGCTIWRGPFFSGECSVQPSTTWSIINEICLFVLRLEPTKNVLFQLDPMQVLIFMYLQWCCCSTFCVPRARCTCHCYCGASAGMNHSRRDANQKKKKKKIHQRKPFVLLHGLFCADGCIINERGGGRALDVGASTF